MADINFDCPACGQNLDAPPDMAGLEIVCPSCENTITIPSAESTEKAAATPQEPQPDINFDCPHCGQNLDAPPQIVGCVIACPSCSQQITVPEESQPTARPPSRSPSGPSTPPSTQKSPTEDDKVSTQTQDTILDEKDEAPVLDNEDTKGSTVRIEIPEEIREIQRPNRVVTIKRSSLKQTTMHRTGFAPKQQKKKGFFARLFGH